MMLKKADGLILKGFIGPYVVSFFIVEFVLVMQFMWKWIDDLLGRGFAMTDYLELIALFGVTIIPMALPLTVLLSSVMVYGDMAEHFELSSLKSAGLSLVRIFRPAIIVALGTATLSIASSNYFKPKASKAFIKKFNDMRLSKVTFAFEEKIFNLDFKDHAIYIDKKDKDGKNLEEVLIYYVNPRQKYIMDVLTAEHATMEISADGKYLVMDLFDGQQYQEAVRQGSKSNYLVKPDRTLPINRATFKKYRKVFQLKDIFRDMSNMNLERKKFDMLNTIEILEQVDTLNYQIEQRKKENVHRFNKLIGSSSVDTVEQAVGFDSRNLDELTKNAYEQKRPTYTKNSYIRGVAKDVIGQVFTSIASAGGIQESLLDHIPDDAKVKIVDSAKSKMSALTTRTFNNWHQNKTVESNKQKFLLRMHQQYCWAVICILLLFIGGPMGAIVKKGGFGYPMLVAIGFYTSFVIFIILGERLVYSSAVSGAVGAWLPFIILSPFAALVTLAALKDIPISFAFVQSFFKRFSK